MINKCLTNNYKNFPTSIKISPTPHLHTHYDRQDMQTRFPFSIYQNAGLLNKKIILGCQTSGLLCKWQVRQKYKQVVLFHFLCCETSELNIWCTHRIREIGGSSNARHFLETITSNF